MIPLVVRRMSSAADKAISPQLHRHLKQRRHKYDPSGTLPFPELTQVSPVNRNGMHSMTVKNSMVQGTEPVIKVVDTFKQISEFIDYQSYGHSKLIQLNRPTKGNALTLCMVKSMLAALEFFSASPGLSNIIIMAKAQPHSGRTKMFCSGGDVIPIATGDCAIEYAKEFFSTEYMLNHALSVSRLPVIAIMDGLTMGGGAGISMHDAYRVSTENTVFAMPESAIGFFPDVGGIHTLASMPDFLGVYLALTGESLKGQEAMFAGVATHYVPSSRVAVLLERLSSINDPKASYHDIIGEFSGTIDKTGFDQFRQKLSWIKEFFHHPYVTDIIQGLAKKATVSAGDKGLWINRTLAKLRTVSPTSLIITHCLLREQLRLKRPLHQVLVKDFQTALYFCRHTQDFNRGVTERLVKKNRDSPISWNPLLDFSCLEAEKKVIEHYVEALKSDKELALESLKSLLSFAPVSN